MLQVLKTFSRMTSSLSAQDKKFAWENYNRFLKVGVNHVKYLRNQENVLSTFRQFKQLKIEIPLEFNEHPLYHNFHAFYARQCEQICLPSVLKYFLLYRLKTNKRKWTFNMIGACLCPPRASMPPSMTQ